MSAIKHLVGKYPKLYPPIRDVSGLRRTCIRYDAQSAKTQDLASPAARSVALNSTQSRSALLAAAAKKIYD